MHKAAALALATLGLPSLCSAQEIGLGMSLRQGDTAIYLPVKTSHGLLIEGFLNYDHSNQSSQVLSASGPDGSQSFSMRSLVLGVGIFWMRPITGNTYAYLGPRLGYTTLRSSTSGPLGTGDTTNHGYTVSPTLGIEYCPIKHFSIGGEIGYRYTKLDSSSTYSGFSGSGSSSSANDGTVTSIIMRYYF